MGGKDTPHDYSLAYKLLLRAVASGEAAAEPFLKQCHELLQADQAPGTQTSAATNEKAR